MTAPKKTREKKHRKPALSAEQIAHEALSLVDDEGLDAFSFRRLAKRLNCEAMSIYHYYSSKQHLIDAMVSICLSEVDIPDPDLPMRDAMRQFARNYRATALRHPGFAIILVTHRLNHREGLEWLDRGIGILGDDLPLARKAVLFRVFSYFITGAAVDEAMGYAKGPGAAEPYPLEDAQRDFPTIMSLGAFFGPEGREAFFDAGIDVLLDWFEKELAAARNSKTE
jgi:AcrR family transcriptional regulator